MDRKQWLAASAAAIATGVAASVYNWRKAKLAERQTPPVGEFATVDGVRIHYLRRGQGPTIVLIHGNGVMLQDWTVPGVFDALAADHDVIAVDRPGAGYSERPRSVIWSPEKQAEVIVKLMRQLGVSQATVAGHSYGATVAAALGLNHPEVVSKLVLLGGFYFPTPRVDLVAAAAPAFPITGDIQRYTVNPIAGRALMPVIEKKLFGPAPVSSDWTDKFPIEMIFRPWQVRATAADFGLALPAARRLSPRFAGMKPPTTIMAGTGDKIVGFDDHSRRLSETIPGSRLVPVEGAGHMVHYTARDAVLREIRAA